VCRDEWHARFLGGGGAATRPRYPTGLLFLALNDETGNLIWISSARRGAASEITTARHDHLADRLRAAGLGALADLGFTGLDPDPGDPVIITGYKSTRTSKTTPAQRHANQALSAARAPSPIAIATAAKMALGRLFLQMSHTSLRSS
jgi:hypothetical protein